jgi:hypothetical protein
VRKSIRRLKRHARRRRKSAGRCAAAAAWSALPNLQVLALTCTCMLLQRLDKEREEWQKQRAAQRDAQPERGDRDRNRDVRREGYAGPPSSSGRGRQEEPSRGERQAAPRALMGEDLRARLGGKKDLDRPDVGSDR